VTEKKDKLEDIYNNIEMVSRDDNGNQLNDKNSGRKIISREGNSETNCEIIVNKDKIENTMDKEYLINKKKRQNRKGYVTKRGAGNEIWSAKIKRRMIDGVEENEENVISRKINKK
jgi:hypothetical protein